MTYVSGVKNNRYLKYYANKKRVKYNNYLLSGCIYPDVKGNIIEQIGKVPDELLVYSYGFTFNGELIVPEYKWNIYQLAELTGISLIMVLVPFSYGAFHNQLIKALFENKEMENYLVGKILQVLKNSNFKGICLDFDYISPVYAFRYAEFVNRLRKESHNLEKMVYVALPSKQTDNEKGLHLEGINYEMLGNNADAVYLKTYEWGYMYGSPGPCSPAHEVEKTVEYAVSRIASDKILLGVSTYGFDWPLPYEKGITRARKISNQQAQKNAEEKGAVIEYGEISKSPWFKYKENGMDHIVWFEDAFSIRIKQEIAMRYHLKGIYYNDFRMKNQENTRLAEYSEKLGE